MRVQWAAPLGLCLTTLLLTARAVAAAEAEAEEHLEPANAVLFLFTALAFGILFRRALAGLFLPYSAALLVRLSCTRPEGVPWCPAFRHGLPEARLAFTPSIPRDHDGDVQPPVLVMCGATSRPCACICCTANAAAAPVAFQGHPALLPMRSCTRAAVATPAACCKRAAAGQSCVQIWGLCVGLVDQKVDWKHAGQGITLWEVRASNFGTRLLARIVLGEPRAVRPSRPAEREHCVRAAAVRV